MREIKKIVWKFLNYLGLGASLQLYLKSGLQEDGWFRSFHTKQSINEQGNPIPWYNYTFIRFLTPRLSKDMSVFEYGAGNSTLWYAEKVAFIKAVENNEAWVHKLQNKLPQNAKIIYKSLENEDYQNEICTTTQKYDLIVVDGRRRNDCVMKAIPFLSERGILILDNSERTDYEPAKIFMKTNGFKSIDFMGIAPITPQNTCTTIFYKSGNCLNI